MYTKKVKAWKSGYQYFSKFEQDNQDGRCFIVIKCFSFILKGKNENSNSDSHSRLVIKKLYSRTFLKHFLRKEWTRQQHCTNRNFCSKTSIEAAALHLSLSCSRLTSLEDRFYNMLTRKIQERPDIWCIGGLSISCSAVRLFSLSRSRHWRSSKLELR